MNWLNCSKIRLILVGFVAAIVLGGGGSAIADFTFGEPTNLGPTVNSDSDDALPAISADGLECYFLSDRPGGQGGFDLWVTTRATTYDSWSPAENVVAPINSASDDGTPTISADGLSLYFSSNRLGGHGNFDLYVATRPSRSDAWGTPVNLGPPVNTWEDQWASSLSADGLELYFCDWHVYLPGGYGNGDIWVSARASVSDAWNPTATLPPQLLFGNRRTSSFFGEKMRIVFSINQKDYSLKTTTSSLFTLNCFRRSWWSSSLVQMNLTEPSFKRTQPPFGSWLSKVNSSYPPCLIHYNYHWTIINSYSHILLSPIDFSRQRSTKPSCVIS